MSSFMNPIAPATNNENNEGGITMNSAAYEIVAPASKRSVLEYLELDFASKEVTRILATHSEAQRFFVANNIDDPFVVVTHDFDKDTEDGVVLQAEWIQCVLNGITVHFVPEREPRHYSCVFASPSNIRSAQSIFMWDAITPFFKDWATAYTDVSSLPGVKQAQAWTLMLSTTTTWSKMFPHVPAPEFKDAYIGEDLEHGEIDNVIFSDTNENMVEAMKEIVSTLSDGQSFIIVNDLDKTYEEIEQMKAEMRGCSLRFPGVKVSAQFIMASTFIYLMNRNHVESFSDAYGRVFTKDHLPSIILFKSGFKLSKVIKTKEQIDTFVRNAELCGHVFSVCITEHNPTRDMPAQVLQCMNFDIQTAKWLATKAYDTIKPYFGSKSSYLVGGNFGKAVDAFPEMRGDSLFEDTWHSAIMNWTHRLIGGRFPKVVKYHIVAMDPFAVCKHVIGCDMKGHNAIGMIPEDHVICNYYQPGTELVTYRMPNNDNNLSVLTVIAPPKDYEGFYIGTSAFVSMHGFEMLLKQMDFDGDKIGCFRDSELVSLAKKCIAKQDRKPLQLRALSKPEPKDSYGIEDWQNFVISLIAAPVGLCANAASMAWGFLPEGQERKDLIYLASELSTLVIDRAKNPDDKGAACNAEDLIRSISPKLGSAMYDKTGALRNVKMPRFNAWAKSSWADMEAWGNRVNNTRFAPQSGLDWYCGFLRKNLHGREGMNESKIVLEQPIVWKSGITSRAIARMFCVNGERKRIEGLSDLFDNLARTATEEYKAAMSKSVNQKQAQTTWTNQYVFAACTDFVKGVMPEASDSEVIRMTVTGLATTIYCRVNDRKANEAKRIFWQVFGEFALNILYENQAAGLWEKINAEDLIPKGAEVDMSSFEPPMPSAEDAEEAPADFDEEFSDNFFTDDEAYEE